MPESRETRQDRGIVLLLQALPEDRLERVLEALGIEPERRAEARKDPRRCAVCGNGYLRCREIDALAPDDHHEWSPRT